MKFFFFHLMPYAGLDLDYDKTHPSPWVTLPNSYYDPEIGHHLYHRYLDELELADELGFDGICVNEHHETAYGLMPAPNVLAGALSRRASRAKIAVLGRALPITDNPLTIAEEFAMIDTITKGRLIAGFVRGIGTEYHVTGAVPAHSHARFHEAHDLIVRAWTETGPFAYEGKHYNFNYVNIWPRPYQKPHPPIWIPSQGSRETIEWAAHPDRKYTYLQTFSPLASVRKALQQYHEVAEGHGYAAQASQIGWALPIYVSHSDEAAKREAAPHIEAFFNKFLKSPVEYKVPPGYTSIASTKAMLAAKFKIRDQVLTIDTLMAQGMILCGSPRTVADQIATNAREMNLGNLICMLQFATLPAELTEQNLRLFASEVMPRVNTQMAVAAQ